MQRSESELIPYRDRKQQIARGRNKTASIRRHASSINALHTRPSLSFELTRWSGSSAAGTGSPHLHLRFQLAAHPQPERRHQVAIPNRTSDDRLRPSPFHAALDGFSSSPMRTKRVSARKHARPVADELDLEECRSLRAAFAASQGSATVSGAPPLSDRR